MLIAFDSFNYGGIAFPLAASDASADDGLLTACDPPVKVMLDFFAAGITSHVEAPLLAAAAAANVAITSAVAMKLTVAPDAVANLEQLSFPCLAVWRKRTLYAGRTVSRRQDATIFGVAYVLPAMTAAQSTQITPVLTAVGKVIDVLCHCSYDPNYQGGAPIILNSGLGKLSLTDAQYMSAPFDTAMTFHAWIAQMEGIEHLLPATKAGVAVPYTEAQTTIGDNGDVVIVTQQT